MFQLQTCAGFYYQDLCRFLLPSNLLALKQLAMNWPPQNVLLLSKAAIDKAHLFTDLSARSYIQTTEIGAK